MKRGELLAITECTMKRFDNLALYGRLPFAPEGGPDSGIPFHVDAKSERARRWRNYTILEALNLGVMLSLIDNDGLPLDAGKYVATNCINKLRWLDQGPNDSWLVYAQDKVNGEGNIGRILKACDADGISAAIAEVAHDGLAFVTMVNATQISNSIVKKALELGILTAEEAADAGDGKPIWNFGMSVN